MTPTGIGAVVLACAVVLALTAGLALRARSGRVLRTAEPDEQGGQGEADASAAESVESVESAESPETRMLRSAGLPDDGPCVVHFSADWCGPCGAVRRVVQDVVARLGTESGAGNGVPVHDLELDLDEHAELARELHVMSLPTTFLYDGAGHRRARIAGVPSASDLAEALRALR